MREDLFALNDFIFVSEWFPINLLTMFLHSFWFDDDSVEIWNVIEKIIHKVQRSYGMSEFSLNSVNISQISDTKILVAFP